MTKLNSSSHELRVAFARRPLVNPEMTQHRIDIYQARFVQTEIGTMPTILIICRITHDSGTHRIQMNVAHQFSEIAIALTKRRLVSALQKMADATIPAVVILAVTR